MISIRKLSNGATVVLEPIPHVRSAAVGVFVNVGSRNEVPDNNGISHFIEHMLFKGTGSRSARDIAEVFEEMGGQLNAYTAREYTCYYTRVLDEKLNEAMDVLFDMLYNSQMASAELDVERGVIVEEINMYEDTPDDLVHDIFSQTIFSGHSLGRPILGSVDNIEGIQARVIYDYYKMYYRPENMIIAVAGNIDADAVCSRLESYEGYLTDSVTFPVLDAPAMGAGMNLVTKDTEQVQICLGVPGISYLDERRYTQNIMNSILGGGISSRLFQKIREEKGLAYSVYSYPSTYRDVGTYVIYVGTSVAKVPEFFQILRRELNGFVSDGVTAVEVDRTKNQIKANMYMGMESVVTRMNRLGKSMLLYGRVPSVDEMIERVFAVTPEMVRTYARETFDTNPFTLACIGEGDAITTVRDEFSAHWGNQ
ncbi:MAG: M16 family metallopeptidase [Solirubrobacterales bacterium]